MKRDLAALLAIAVVASAAPAVAHADVGGADRLRRLNIMLEVGAQRCSGGAHDYTEDYRRFAATHRRELKQADAELRQELNHRYGKVRADRELERGGTAIANGYGQGHPWLDCGQLGLVARNLTQVLGRPTLEEAADQLIRSPGKRMAVAR